MSSRVILLFILATLWASTVRGQSLLEDPAVFATVVGLNTVPDHGDTAVSFLDYRDGGYSIVVVDVSTQNEHELERVFFAEPVVSTFGQRVAWIGYTPLGQADVYMHDRSAGSTSPITSDSPFQNHPDLSGDVLVWQDYRNAGSTASNADIFFYAFGEDVSAPVTTDPGYQDLPSVSGERVVWQDYRHADTSMSTADIYVHDLATNQEQRLTEGAYYRTNPEIWGELVVWEDYRDGENGEIYLYDLSLNDEMRITTNTAHQSHPAVYGDWILWIDYRNSSEQGDIYGYHLGTNEEYALLVHPAHQDAPHTHGKHVVWQDYRNGRFDLYGATLLNPSMSSVDDHQRRADVEMSAAPNPFADRVTITLPDEHSYASAFAVYDALGRIVARETIPTGAQRIEWDGRTDAGFPAPPGVYVAIIKGVGQVGEVLLVRER